MNDNILIEEEKERKKEKVGRYILGIGIPLVAIGTSALVVSGSYFHQKRKNKDNLNEKNLDANFFRTIEYRWHNDYLWESETTQKSLTPNNKDMTELLDLADINIFSFEIQKTKEKKIPDDIKDLIKLGLISKKETHFYTYTEKEANAKKEAENNINHDQLLNLLINKEDRDWPSPEVKNIVEKYTTGKSRVVEIIKKVVKDNWKKKINIWVPASWFNSTTSLFELYGFDNVRFLCINGNRNEYTPDEIAEIQEIFEEVFCGNQEFKTMSELLRIIESKEKFAYMVISSYYKGFHYFFYNKENVKKIRNIDAEKDNKFVKRIYAYSPEDAKTGTIDDYKNVKFKEQGTTKLLTETTIWKEYFEDKFK